MCIDQVRGLAQYIPHLSICISVTKPVHLSNALRQVQLYRYTVMRLLYEYNISHNTETSFIMSTELLTRVLWYLDALSSFPLEESISYTSWRFRPGFQLVTTKGADDRDGYSYDTLSETTSRCFFAGKEHEALKVLPKNTRERKTAI